MMFAYYTYNDLFCVTPPKRGRGNPSPWMLECYFKAHSDFPNFECNFKAHYSKIFGGFFLLPFKRFGFLFLCTAKVKRILLMGQVFFTFIINFF